MKKSLSLSLFVPAVFLFVLLSSCVAPITDAQVKYVAEACEKQGGTITVYNTVTISKIECVLPE